MKREFNKTTRVVCVKNCCDHSTVDQGMVSKGDTGTIKYKTFYPDEKKTHTFLEHHGHDISDCFESLEKPERTMFNHFDVGDEIEAMDNVHSTHDGSILWANGFTGAVQKGETAEIGLDGLALYRKTHSSIAKACDYTMHFRKVEKPNKMMKLLEKLASSNADLARVNLEIKELEVSLALHDAIKRSLRG